MDRFWRSASPFCSGVSGEVVSWRIPRSFKNFFHSLERNSPPLSVRKMSSLQPVSFSTNVNHSLNAAKASLLCFKNDTQTQRDLSSVNVMTYRVPLSVGTGAGPHKSQCTRPRTCSACPLLEAGNDARVALPLAHDAHIGGVILNSFVDSLTPLIVPLRTMALIA